MKNYFKDTPQWILYLAVFQAILIIYYGSMFFVNSNPSIAGDPAFAAGIRNVAVLFILLFGIFKKDTTILLCAFLLRFIIDFGDMISAFLGGDMMAGLSIIPVMLIPTGRGIKVLYEVYIKNSHYDDTLKKRL